MAYAIMRECGPTGRVTEGWLRRKYDAPVTVAKDRKVTYAR